MKLTKIPLPSQRRLPKNNSSTVRTEYSILLIQVNKLFNIHLSDFTISDELLEEHCDMIAKYIEDNGWSIDDFIIKYVCNVDNNNYN